MSIFLIRPEVWTEAQSAAEWYDQQQLGLGSDLTAEIEVALELIQHFPLRFPVVYRRDVRRARLDRFPFNLFYRLRKDEIVVLALEHARRSPRLIRRHIRRAE